MDIQRSSASRYTKATIAIAAVVLVLSLGLLGPRMAAVLSGGFTRSAPGGAFEYAVHREHGSVEIDVTFSGRGGRADVQRYLEANAARAQALLRSAVGERLRTTITFARPLPAREVEQLLRNAGVEAASYTQVGWTAAGQRMASTIFRDPGATDFDLERAAQEAISSDPAAPDYGATMAGFMVVDGVLTVSEQSLGRLLADPRVYLVDTTAYEVQKLVGVADAAVRLPTPFWDLDWGDQ
ncbi:MAG: hypothetical protein RMN53_07475 [Anaerolineae bacterium]|nr:hypothetical protein [Anaerolineae bacterium]